MKVLLLSIACACIVYGCPSTTPVDVDRPTTATVRSNIRPDSTSGWLYYSIENDSIVTPADAARGAWDIRMAFLKGGGATRTIDILLNHEVNVQGYIARSRFENVTSVPSDAPFRREDTSVVNRIVPNCVTCPDAVFVYDPLKHTILPAPDRTLVVKLRTGTMFKFQVVSIYENANENPSLTTPIGYYHWRMQRIN